MKSINILIAIISGSIVLIYIVTGFDFTNKEKLAQVANSVSFIIFLLALCGVYSSFKKKNND